MCTRAATNMYVQNPSTANTIGYFDSCWISIGLDAHCDNQTSVKLTKTCPTDIMIIKDMIL